jgi:hypothetical protein
MLSQKAASPSRSSSKRLRVNDPADAYEREADKVADTVASGGRISSWSLSSSGSGRIQRDSDTAPTTVPTQPPIRDPQDLPAPNNYGDMLGKLAEAIKDTPAAKVILQYLNDQPIVKEAKDFVQTPEGIAVAGTTAVATIATLAATGKSLPMQIPAIPLDKLYPGLKVKIDYEGELTHPTQGSLTFIFGPASPKKKKDSRTASEKYREQTARMAQDMKFGAGVDPSQLGPDLSSDAQQREMERKAVEAYEMRKIKAITDPATYSPSTFLPLVPSAQPKSLGMHDHADDAPTDDTPKDSTSKKEEVEVQRKADSVLEHLPNTESEVDSVLSSSGRPLDRHTAQMMEARIGFDFSKVRIHHDARAGATAKALGARAYTAGENIVFAPGRYAPHSSEGQRLIAHELTHVVQQSPQRGADADSSRKP